MNNPCIGIGVVGYGFMGKVHSNAYLKIPYTYQEPAAYPLLISMCGRNEKAVIDTARRFGYQHVCTDWKELIEDPSVQIVDNCTPDSMHAEPSIAAVQAEKHVICEKPLAMTVAEAKEMRDEACNAGVKHMLCHNYRFMPAVRLAKKLIEEGELGRIYQFRGVYLQEVGHGPSEVLENVWYATGTRSGVLLGIGSHIIDMARFLLGEMEAVAGMVRTFNTSRKDSSGKTESVTADEVNGALVEFTSGAVGTIESAGVSTGRKNQLSWEINGSKGSLRFDLEDLNHLHVCLDKTAVQDVRGFTNISVTDFSHPLQSMILPPGHNTGWEYGHVHALNHFIECVAADRDVAPYGATFEDGYRIQVIMDAIVQSSRDGKKRELLF
ncbi:MAG: Gfo/Idh/MocA family oxidoreductase [Spirochaetes bacterium]|nr:Gfo/Idh/MocA family oxidoreductase [Spirochaetota bacterium]